MHRLTNDRMLRIALELLTFLGEAKGNSIKLHIFRIVNCGVILFNGFFIAANFFHVADESSIKSIQAMIAVTHVFIKYFTLLHYKPAVQLVLSDTATKFWNHQKFSQSVRDATERTIEAVKYTQIIMLTTTIIVAYMYFLRPVFDVNYSFLLETWVPKSYYMDATLLLAQFYLFYIGVPLVVGYDIIFLALCIHVTLQMRLLKCKIYDALDNRKNFRGVINECVRYHQFLQSMFSRMQDIYSVMLLFHYFVTLISTCSDLYEVLMGRSGLNSIAIKFLSVIVFFAQFAYYTFLAEQVAFEFSDLSHTVYLSRWYRNSISLQKTVLLIMIRSQRVEYFSGAGLMDINVGAFGSVVRKTLSFYTILRNLINK